MHTFDPGVAATYPARQWFEWRGTTLWTAGDAEFHEFARAFSSVFVDASYPAALEYSALCRAAWLSTDERRGLERIFRRDRVEAPAKALAPYLPPSEAWRMLASLRPEYAIGEFHGKNLRFVMTGFFTGTPEQAANAAREIIANRRWLWVHPVAARFLDLVAQEQARTMHATFAMRPAIC